MKYLIMCYISSEHIFSPILMPYIITDIPFFLYFTPFHALITIRVIKMIFYVTFYLPNRGIQSTVPNGIILRRTA